MSVKSIEIYPHHTKSELQSHYKKATNPTERTKLHFLSIVRNKIDTSTELAVSIQTGMKRVGMKLTWAQDTIRRYNKDGLEGIKDARKNNKRPPIIRAEEKQKLSDALKSENAPDGGLWTGPKVAMFLGEVLGKKISAVTGWRQLVALGYSIKAPRLAHEKRATKEEQNDFKKNSACFIGK